MHYTRGFRKSYFSLSAILAYSTAVRLHSQATVFTQTLPAKGFVFQEELEEDESPPNVPISLLELNTQKPCHCNSYFTDLSKLLVMLCTYIPRCLYYTTYFAFRRSGIHPPLHF